LVLFFFLPEGFIHVHLLQFTVTADDLYWAYYLRMRKEIMIAYTYLFDSSLITLVPLTHIRQENAPNNPGALGTPEKKP
jgi:hypothetical protein